MLIDMQEVAIIGHIADSPAECHIGGKRVVKFVVRAENSPKDSNASSFDFEVTTGNFSLLDRLSVGANIYVSGLLSIHGDSGRMKASIQGMVFNLLDRPKDIEDIKLEMVSRTIPLQDI